MEVQIEMKRIDRYIFLPVILSISKVLSKIDTIYFMSFMHQLFQWCLALLHSIRENQNIGKPVLHTKFFGKKISFTLRFRI